MRGFVANVGGGVMAMAPAAPAKPVGVKGKPPAAPGSTPGSTPGKGKPTTSKGVDKRTRVHISLKTFHCVVQWPVNFIKLTDDLDPDKEDGIAGKLQASIVTGLMKKLAPLSLDNARRILDYILPHKQAGTVKLTVDEDFRQWMETEAAAAESAVDATYILEKTAADVSLTHPEMKVPLYWWQASGYEFLNITTRQGKGALLCDRTGLGKTFTSTAHLITGKYKAVVICPAGLRINWQKKIQLLCNMSTYVMGSKDAKEYPVDLAKYDIIIVSYNMLKRFAAWPLGNIVESQGRVLIIDEAHMVRNPDAHRTHHVKWLAARAHHCIPITATPLVNKVRELHPLLTITRRHWTKMSESDFIKEYETEEGEKEIADRLKGIMLRRHGEDVWEGMPDSKVGEIDLKLSNRDDYDAAERDLIKWLMSRGAHIDQLDRAERGAALVKLNTLRRLAAEGKVEEAAEIIENTLECGEQTVVFCSFNGPLLALAEKFKNHTGTNIKGQAWRGAAAIIQGVTETERQRIMADFEAGRIGLLVIGIEAGGLGIDLPAACIGYFLDLPWTPAAFEQATGRLLRIGQTRKCQFIKLLAANTIDAKMQDFLYRKAHTFANAIGDDRAVGRISSQPAEMMTQSRAVQAILGSYTRGVA